MELKQYLDRAVSPWHITIAVKERLKEAGFRQIFMKDLPAIERGRYYVDMYGTGLIAFEKNEGPFHIAAAHTDYPCFKIKPQADLGSASGIMRFNAEPYGGMIKRTWFDRPLAMAGAVWTKGSDVLNPDMYLIDSSRPLFVIPSLAPHMDREIETKPIDVQKEMMPLYGLEREVSVIDVIAECAGVNAEEILSYDINVYPAEEALVTGFDSEFIMSKGIDNIASVAALTESICKEKERNYSPMICLFNNEEIGSSTKQGGDSGFLEEVLSRITDIYEGGSFILSADGAHAVHPAYPEKSDVTSKAIMGKGFVIKTSASQRYATDGYMTAVIRSICDEKDIPYQLFANRSGSPGGSTLGPIVSSHIPIHAADVGIPMLAMHSACELIAVFDYESFELFFGEVL